MCSVLYPHEWNKHFLFLFLSSRDLERSTTTSPYLTALITSEREQLLRWTPRIPLIVSSAMANPLKTGEQTSRFKQKLVPRRSALLRVVVFSLSRRKTAGSQVFAIYHLFI